MPEPCQCHTAMPMPHSPCLQLHECPSDVRSDCQVQDRDRVDSVDHVDHVDHKRIMHRSKVPAVWQPVPAVG
eukprot:365993-Chlamydomonas_euryale.AAC.5